MDYGGATGGAVLIVRNMRARTPTSPARTAASKPPRLIQPRGVRRWLFDFGRSVRRRRRILAALAAVAAVLAGLTALAPPSPETTTVVAAARQLGGGSVLAAADLKPIELPTALVPDGAARDPAQLIGKALAGPQPAGQVLTETALLHYRTRGSNAVVAALPLADDRVSQLLQPGDVVDVLAAANETGRTRVVATGVRVITGALTQADSSGGGLAGNLTGGSSGDRGRGLALVEVTPATAAGLTQASATGALTVVWH